MNIISSIIEVFLTLFSSSRRPFRPWFENRGGPKLGYIYKTMIIENAHEIITFFIEETSILGLHLIQEIMVSLYPNKKFS